MGGDARGADGFFAIQIPLMDECALALRALQHAAVDKLLKRAMRGDERDGELFGHFFGGRHLLAGRQVCGGRDDEPADGPGSRCVDRYQWRSCAS